MEERDYYQDPERYEAECGRFTVDLQWYRDQAKKIGGPVLVAGCGTGRVLFDLALAGIKADGLDQSPDMLLWARTRMLSLGPKLTYKPRLIEADMKDFSLGKKYNIVLFPLNTFMHLHTDTDVKDCLACVSDHIMENGRLVLDVTNPLPLFLENTKQPGGTTLRDIWVRSVCYEQIEHHSYHPKSQISETVFSYIPKTKNSTPYSTRLKLRMFSPQTLETLLKENMFQPEKKYGSFNEDPFIAEESPTQIVVAIPENQ